MFCIKCSNMSVSKKSTLTDFLQCSPRLSNIAPISEQKHATSNISTLVPRAGWLTNWCVIINERLPSWRRPLRVRLHTRVTAHRHCLFTVLRWMTIHKHGLSAKDFNWNAILQTVRVNFKRECSTFFADHMLLVRSHEKVLTKILSCPRTEQYR